jgi:hypothetical protein
MSVLNKLTEGIVNRNLQKEGAALLDKWESTGLLEGLDGRQKDSMSVLLENQAKELLREASSMAAGDVEGFASVAFPIVRRVFGGLIANDLVSVQPMSLPSGLIFFMDFTYESARLGLGAGDSVYGGGVVAAEVTGGVTDITGSGFYNLANAYSSPTGSIDIDDGGADGDDQARIGSLIDTASTKLVSSLSEADKKAIRYDPDLLADSTAFVGELIVQLSQTNFDRINLDMLGALDLKEVDNTDLNGGTGAPTVIRRLTKLTSNRAAREISFFIKTTAAVNLTTVSTNNISGGNSLRLFHPVADSFTTGDGVGAVVGQDAWPLEEPQGATGNQGSTVRKDEIAEIDIKVDSVAVTAVTKKLKAKWSPELGQDLQAYHNLDAEVELTSILSEQIALEIDRELLNDLVQGATAGTYYWSRRPGRFLDRASGSAISDYANESLLGADFTGTVSEWYETLVETINDVSAQIHRKTLRGGANFVVCSPEVANILEFTSGFRASITHDDDRGNVGAVKAGNLSKKWDVYVDPYFPRNVVLVGRKGGSFLESGYVYAPYVPLQVTPTIFGTEDFVPRKGVMTRYAKKMVRPDMYGLVVCQDFGG